MNIEQEKLKIIRSMRNIGYNDNYIKKVLKDSNNESIVIAEDKEHLKELIFEGIEKYGIEVDLNYIDTSNITDMSYLFKGIEFNGNISQWNVSNVIYMNNMFKESELFNQDIGNWDVSNVKDMTGMFIRAKSFNQDIGNWEVSNVKDTGYMFYEAKSFNQPIGNWDISNVKDMRYMFSNAESFNQNLDNWNVSNVTGMKEIFDNSGMEYLPSWYKE